jgi:16S rRNA U516 pseudouridylate synthase RsuA-like enzyme
MLEELGYDVADLKRISIGDVDLRGLEEGEFRFLTKSEIISLIRRRKDIYGLRKFKK